MLRSLERFLQLFETRGQKYIICNDKVYIAYAHVAGSFGPMKFDYSLSESDARHVLKQLGSPLIRWTDGFGKGKCEEWYAVICDEFKELADLKSKKRSEINRGLRNCEAKVIDTECLSKFGYEVYLAACSSYSNPPKTIWHEEEFKNYILSAEHYEDIVHYWGVFHGGHLIAFAENNIFDRVEANYAYIYFHPDYLKLYPSYALLHKMNEFYLKEQQFEYVNDGWRSVLHQTNIQDFLMKNFNFKPAHTNLSVMYKKPFGLLTKLTYPLRGLLGKIDSRLDALYTQESARRACSRTQARS